MYFTTSFSIYNPIAGYSDLVREHYSFVFYDGKIVLDAFDLEVRAGKRHKFKPLDIQKNSYRRHLQRDFKRQRSTITIPGNIKEAALAYIRDQIRIEE